MKILNLSIFIFITIILQSCATSKAIQSYGADLSKYSYVVFGKENSGDRELDDIIMMVQNEIAQTKLIVISSQTANYKIASGEHVLTPNIHVSSEKWDGGHTYITITFYDYNTDQSIVVVKSSGIGLTVAHDQYIAISAIRNKLQQIFGEE